MSSFARVPIDDVRSYWDRRPCNIRHSPAPVGTEEYFNQVEARKYFVEPHIPGFAQFERWTGKKVLEVGCGIGTDTINFARAGAEVTAVDLSSESLSVAEQRARVYGLQDRIRFFNGNAEVLSEVIPVEAYDLVYSFGVLHHTPRPDRAFAQLRHFTRPGTTLKVMVYNRWSYKVLGILLTEGQGRFWNLDQLVAQHSEAEFGSPVTYIYSRRSGRRLVERHGFTVTESRVEHIFPYQVAKYVNYQYERQWWLRVLPPAAFRRLEGTIGWHLLLTATTPDGPGHPTR
jgi:ubiquinone/menaquinone biosynthesis C-methylase UbiE